MFDLEQAIQGWKLTFRPDSSIGTDGVQEVESHLREAIERLQSSGLSTHEAFAVGVHRLGLTTDLEAEFAKNQPVAAWRTRLAWMLGGYIAFTICGGGVSALVALSGAGMAYAGVEARIAGPIAVAVLAIAWPGLLVISYRVLLNRECASDRFTWKWAFLAGAALYTLTLATGLGEVAQKAVVDASWYSDTATWLGFGRFFARVAGYLFCLVAMCKLSKPLVAVAE